MSLVFHDSVCDADKQGLLSVWGLAKRMLAERTQADHGTCELTDTSSDPLKEKWVARIRWVDGNHEYDLAFASHCPFVSIAECATCIDLLVRHRRQRTDAQKEE